MKIEIKILLVTLFISSQVAAQNTWVQKADYAGGVRTGSAEARELKQTGILVYGQRRNKFKLVSLSVHTRINWACLSAPMELTSV
ncbi:MAG: hypothetical protein IPJ66_10795 [Bacteroidetes bacterium]|nr:hypothetical protein [Bacteroidota bacterium]